MLAKICIAQFPQQRRKIVFSYQTSAVLLFSNNRVANCGDERSARAACQVRGRLPHRLSVKNSYRKEERVTRGKRDSKRENNKVLHAHLRPNPSAKGRICLFP